MKIHVYSVAWNERRMLPFYMNHYGAFADRIFIADDSSDDGSREYLAQFPQVTVSHFDNSGDSFLEVAREFGNHAWKQSRGEADWVIICDIDEHVYHPNMREYLTQAKADGITCIAAIGYDMVGDTFPEDTRKPLYELVTQGTLSRAYTKMMVFDPDAVSEINFSHGRHKLQPEGRIKVQDYVELKMLHYKFLGAEYVIQRHAELAARRLQKAGDMAQGFGEHYFKPEDEILQRIDYMKANAKNIHTQQGYHRESLR